MGLAKKIMLKGHMQEEREAINPQTRALCETMMPIRYKKKKKSLTILYTQHRASPIPTPISIKRKELGYEKKISFTLEARNKLRKQNT